MQPDQKYVKLLENVADVARLIGCKQPSYGEFWRLFEAVSDLDAYRAFRPQSKPLPGMVKVRICVGRNPEDGSLGATGASDDNGEDDTDRDLIDVICGWDFTPIAMATLYVSPDLPPLPEITAVADGGSE